MPSNISISFQCTWSKTLFYYWDSGWLGRLFTEKIVSKDYKGMLLNSQSTILSRNTDPLLFIHWKKQQL